MHYYMFEESGGTQVLRTDQPQAHWQRIPDESVGAVFSAINENRAFRMHDGALDVGTPKPDPRNADAWDWTLRQWVDLRPLQDLKDDKWLEIKQARSAAEYGGFVWDGSAFDSDAVSQSRIQGAVQLANMEPGFSVDWTLADNSVRTLSAADMLAVGAALGEHVAAQFSRARAMRSQIAQATSAEELNNIVWSTNA